MSVHLIDTWYSECLQYFPSQLKLRQWYGNKHSIRDLSRQKILIGPANRSLTQYLNDLHPCDPETAGILILTSYTTWQQRSLNQTKNSGDPDESDQGRGKDKEGADHETRGDEATEDEADDNNETEDEEEDPCINYISTFTGRFGRIVCDEAHCMKNYLTRTAISVKKLQCRVSWLITATPMINKMADLYYYDLEY